jgi:hypothetical protein
VRRLAAALLGVRLASSTFGRGAACESPRWAIHPEIRSAGSKGCAPACHDVNAALGRSGFTLCEKKGLILVLNHDIT